MKIYWYTTILLGLAIDVFLLMPDNQVPVDSGSHIIKENCNLSTPRETFRSFLSSVRSFNRDSYSGFDCITKVITSSDKNESTEDKSEIIKKARDVFLVLENIDYDLDDDIPAQVEGDKVQFILKFENQPIKVVMNKGRYGWSFDKSMYNDPEILGLVKKLRYKYAKFTSENMEGDTFVQDLMSPYRTFFTLKSGVEGQYNVPQSI